MPRLLLAPLIAAVCATGGVNPGGGAPSSAVTTAPKDLSGDVAGAGEPPSPEPARPQAANGIAGDLEGALESSDGCPGESETRNGYRDDDGCADELPADLAAIVGVVAGIQFEIDKDVIRPVSRPALDRLVEVLTRHSEVRIEVAVHEDDRSGREAYGRCLTCRRARAVARYLIEHGIEARRIVDRGYGPDRPIASNKTEEGRRQNRRVEIDLMTPDGRVTPRPAVTGAKGACVDRHTLRTTGGASQDCYPYVCRAGVCLTRCDDRRDCAGAQDPSEMAAQGWPLECMPSGACTPMSPDKVQ